jgi:SPP1 family predicted phage head-tail adaptor
MDAGRLRHRVTIQTPTRTTSAVSNAVQIAYTDAATAWAEIRPLSARETTNYAALQIVATHFVSMRYTAIVTGSCRLKFKGRIFDIVGPPMNVDERSFELRMTVNETKPPG